MLTKQEKDKVISDAKTHETKTNRERKTVIANESSSVIRYARLHDDLHGQHDQLRPNGDLDRLC